MKSLLRKPNRSTLLILAVLAGLSASLSGGALAFAGHSACRTDPEVTLSDGRVVVIVADIDVDAAYVQNVVYTLHAPPGTSVVSVRYFGDIPPEREQLVFLDDAKPHHYKTRTVVRTDSNSINVTTTTTVDLDTKHKDGHTNQNLDLDIDAH